MMYRTTDFSSSFFCFNDTATTEIYTLSLHDALPISANLLHRLFQSGRRKADGMREAGVQHQKFGDPADRKSTRLNSSHVKISYAVFCLKKKIIQTTPPPHHGAVTRHLTHIVHSLNRL